MAAAAVGCGDGSGSGDDGDDGTADTDGAGDEDDDDGGQPAVDGMATIEGWVASAADEPLAGVLVRAGDTEATTDDRGHFSLQTAADDGDTIVVRIDGAGWVRALERVIVRDGSVNAVRAVLVPEALAQPLNADAGGAIVGMRGARIDAPPAAFVRRDGTAVSGMVEVHLTPLNPAIPGEYDAYPGDGQARTADGDIVQLETFGVLDVTVRQGEDDLTIADGMGVSVEIPLPDPAPADPPETMPLWSFDEDTGEWVEEGTLTLDLAAGVYRGTITHLSPWNADQPLQSTCLRGRVVDDEDRPISGAWVLGNGVDYLGGSSSVSDDDGEFCLPVRKSSEVEIIVYALDGSVSRIVMSGAEDTAVPPVCTDPRCLDIGTFVIVPGVGDDPWWGASCDAPDLDTHLAVDVTGSVDVTIDASSMDGMVACGWIVDDPAAGEGEPGGSTVLWFNDADGWDVYVAMGLASGTLGSEIDGWVQLARVDGEQDPAIALCKLTIDENDEVADDAFAIGGFGNCEPYPLLDVGVSGTVDFRGIAGRWNGIIPTICCDAEMPLFPGM